MPSTHRTNPTADPIAARRFVERWLDAWNSHDLERVVRVYADDVVFSSPVVAGLLEGSSGVISGKVALREYFEAALRRFPNLHFELLDHYVGIDVLVINYRNHRGGLVNEVLQFDGELVRSAHGTYSDQNPSWVSQLRRIAGAVPSVERV
jgi:hypothetical protein